MAKALIGLGIIIILHTLVAKLTGIAAITDYLPIEWFSRNLRGQVLHSASWNLRGQVLHSASWVLIPN